MRFFISFLLTIPGLFLMLNSHANVIVVTNTNNSGSGSLRQAFISADDGDIIRFSPSLLANGNDTIYLTSTINISDELTLIGLINGSDTLAISGSGSNKIFRAVFPLGATHQNLTMDSVLLIDGYATGTSTDHGGALLFDGDTLRISNSRFSGNYSDQDGGAVAGKGNGLMIIDNCVFEGNRADNHGGGLFFDSYQNGIHSSLTNCIFRRNSNSTTMSTSAAHIDVYSLEVSNCSTYRNSAGGITIDDAFLNMSHCTFSDDTLHGLQLMAVIQEADVSYCTFDGIDGRGVDTYLYSGPSTLRLSNCSINNVSGRGIYYHFQAYLPSDSFLVIRNCSITNSGYGIFSFFNTSVTNAYWAYLIDSYVANNGTGDPGTFGTALFARNNFYVLRSTFTGNHGGNGSAIEGNKLIIDRSTISNNVSNIRGGAISETYSNLPLSITIIRSTIYGNTSVSRGAAIDLYTNDTIGLHIDRSTIYGNFSDSVAPAIYAASYYSDVDVRSSIIVNNSGSPQIVVDTIDSITSAGYNIFGDTSLSGTVSSDTLGVDTSVLDLGPFQNNGGNTFTLVPSMYSPAWNSGPPGDFSHAQNDTTHYIRDIGAAEYPCNTYTDTFVTTCDSFQWSLSGETYFNSGRYDSLFHPNILGCDSLSRLFLTVNYTQSVYHEWLYCDSFTSPSGAITIDSIGEYTIIDTITTVLGCDSIMTIDVKVVPTKYDTILVDTCDSYTSPGGTIIEIPGNFQFTDTFSTVFGCDSLVYFDLNIYPEYDSTLYVQACDSFYWEVNMTTYTSNDYDAEGYTSTHGCDSIHRLYVTILSSNLETIFVDACDQYIRLNGDTLDNPGAYFLYDTLINEAGCDSFLYTLLTIHETVYDTLMTSACGTYVSPSGSTSLSIPGLYFLSDTLLTANGCDSILWIEVEIHPEYNNTDTVIECDSFYWEVNDNWYTISGTYDSTFNSVDGCDSTWILELDIINSSTVTFTIDTCDLYVRINGDSITNPGYYYLYDTLTNAAGCDSVIFTSLNIYPSYIDSITMIACDTYTSPSGNHTYSTAGFYQFFDSLQTENGCDSILYIDLTIPPSYFFETNVSVCDSFLWPVTGEWYSIGGTYDTTYSSIAGCDSSHQLNLTLTQSTFDTTVLSTCDSFYWSHTGSTYFTSGLYVDSLIASSGCDSILALDLHINTSINETIAVAACDSFLWQSNNTIYITSGVYTDTFSAVNSCDSIVTLVLSINPSSFDTIYETACDSFYWEISGDIFYTSGLYFDTMLNAVGCDSVLTLNLTIYPSVNTIIQEAACDSFYWNQTDLTYFQGGIYHDTLNAASGCDSVLTLQLNIHTDLGDSELVKVCTPYTWSVNGLTYDSSGIYIDTIASQLGCDSVVTLNLTIPLVDVTVKDSGLTLIATAYPASFQWIDCADSSLIQGATDSSFTPSQDGYYAVEVNQSGCLDTSDCYEVNGVGIETPRLDAINLFPNPTWDNLNIIFEGSSLNFTIIVYNTLGEIVQEVYTNDQHHLNFEIDGASGVYFVEILNDMNPVARFKVVKH